MDKEEISLTLSGGMQWNMTFKHEREQSVQSLTSVLDMNVNHLHIRFPCACNNRVTKSTQCDNSIADTDSDERRWR